MWFATAVMILTSLPYLSGYVAQGENMRFTGFVFGVEDGNSYIAKMLSGTAGAWSFRTPYTAFPQRGAPVFLPYLLLGKLAAPPGLHEQLVALYHLFRILSGYLAILASYDFLSLFVEEIRLRRAGIALVALGGGLGWLPAFSGRVELFGFLPLEFHSPESFGFLALYGLPHLALARALLLWGFVVYLRAVDSRETVKVFRNGSIAGIYWLLASLAQPLVGIIAGFICAAHLLALTAWIFWRIGSEPQSGWQNWRWMASLALVAGLFVGPFVLANFLVASQDPFLQSWMAQNKILSPPPVHYLLAYGLLLPFAAYGGLRLLKREPWKGWLPVAWILALPVLAYAPVNLQRRFVDGVWVAIVALSLVAIELRQGGDRQVEPVHRPRRWGSILYASAAILAFPSTFLLLAGGIQTALQPVYPVFRPADEVAAFEHLGRLESPGVIVLSAYETGNALPAWSPARVVIGHGPESAGLEALRSRVRDFFTSGTSDSERARLLVETGTKYVFWGPAEHTLGSWDPAMASFLKEIYHEGDYTLFEVVEGKETFHLKGRCGKQRVRLNPAILP